jgi:hypothetical protein
LSEESLARMMVPQITTAAGRMGLVFYETKLAGTRFVGHDGGTMVAGLQESPFPRSPCARP